MTPTLTLINAAVAAIIDGALPNGNYTVRGSQANFNEDSGEGFLENDFHGYTRPEFEQFADGVDVDLGERRITAIPGEGGFRITSNATLPEGEGQSMFGYQVYDEDNARIVGHKKFQEAKSFSGPNQQVILEPPSFIFRESALS